jgi:hypothetical protein
VNQVSAIFYRRGAEEVREERRGMGVVKVHHFYSAGFCDLCSANFKCFREPAEFFDGGIGPRITRSARIKASAAKSIREIREIHGPIFPIRSFVCFMEKAILVVAPQRCAFCGKVRRQSFNSLETPEVWLGGDSGSYE